MGVVFCAHATFHAHPEPPVWKTCGVGTHDAGPPLGPFEPIEKGHCPDAHVYNVTITMRARVLFLFGPTCRGRRVCMRVGECSSRDSFASSSSSSSSSLGSGAARVTAGSSLSGRVGNRDGRRSSVRTCACARVRVGPRRSAHAS